MDGATKPYHLGLSRGQRKGISLQSPKWLPTSFFDLKFKFEAIDHVLQLLFDSVEQQLDRLLFDSAENQTLQPHRGGHTLRLSGGQRLYIILILVQTAPNFIFQL